MSSLSLRPLVVHGVETFAHLFVGHEREASEALVELIVGISSYSEEGLAYAPVVFVTTDLPATLATVRGANPLVIGRERTGLSAARAALRSCAPLGEGRRWAIFLLLSGEGFEYGLFCTESSPLRPTSFELLRRARTETPLVGLTQLRAGVVEIRASSGQEAYVDFSGSAEQAKHPGYVVQTFVTSVTASAPEPLRAPLQAFYYRIAVEILTGDHGALVVVVPPSASAPAYLADGLWLPEPIDLAAWIAREGEPPASGPARALIAYAQLIRRMTMMDGITVFGADGTVRAYGCFLRGTAQGDSTQARGLGGARRRAFDRLRTHVGSELVAALYRSQDGAADCISTVTVA